MPILGNQSFLLHFFIMNFFTKIDIPAIDWQIDYNSHIAFFGSCFADNISAQFASRKFNVLVNPFGTVYNPLSIAKQIKAIANKQVFGGPEVFQDMRPDRSGNSAPWHCWDAHGSLSAATREECVAKLNEATNDARIFLQQANTVFITLGTSFVYFLKESGIAVSNCHRQDPRLFERRMISVDEAAEALIEIVESLRKIRCDWIASPGSRASLGVSVACNDEQRESRALHIVFTVSPLRHLSDGAHANTLSKATLQLAINKVIQEIASPSARNDVGAETISYFPSYEIVMDELRDYRFYDNDMIHLSKATEEYIFERMKETYCSEKMRENICKVEKFMKMANHHIQNADSPATATFQQKLQAEAQKLESQIAGLKLNV